MRELKRREAFLPQLEERLGEVKRLRGDVAALQAELETFAPEARLDPAVIERQLEEAMERQADCDAVLRQGRQQFAEIEDRLAKRRTIEAELRKLENELANCRQLAERRLAERPGTP
jgi:hypothetical protein